MRKDQEGTTRYAVLNLLKIGGSVSVHELAEKLGITEMAIRRHLNTLEKDGLIQSSLVRQAVGRPANLYSLTEKGEEIFPRNYSNLMLEFLNEIEDDFGEETIGRLFEKRREKLLHKYIELIPNDSLESKVEQLMHIQNENGYMAQWEKDENNGTIKFKEFNCPIAHIAHKYNHACHSELKLFEDLLDAKVERKECLAKGGHQCLYVIEQRNA